MPRYSIDVKLYGTLYVTADTPEAAREKALRVGGTERAQEPIDLGRSQDFETDEAGVSLSPAFTAYGLVGEVEQTDEPEIDYLATAKSYGFRIDTRQAFETTCAVAGLKERADTYQGTHVMWDPSASVHGFMVVGDDPEALAREWVDARPDDCEHVTYKTEV